MTIKSESDLLKERINKLEKTTSNMYKQIERQHHQIQTLMLQLNRVKFTDYSTKSK